MTRWIDADELMKQFPCTTSCKKCGLGKDGFLPCDIKDKIKEAPTVGVPHGEWIPCSERLPDKSGKYIVTEKHFSIDDAKHNGWYQTVVDEAIFSNDKWGRAKFIEVLAWMPLPDPYEEGEAE